MIELIAEGECWVITINHDITFDYIIELDHHGHNSQAGGFSMNNYNVRENKVRGINYVRENN